MNRRGVRMIEGRELLLVDTTLGWSAKIDAQTEAKKRRDRGEFVRIIRRRAYHYAVYAIGSV